MRTANKGHEQRTGIGEITNKGQALVKKANKGGTEQGTGIATQEVHAANKGQALGGEA